jgi:signal transduction histidine kinase
MAQAFCHLLDNALRFTPEHGTITVGLREDGELLLWTVKDTGIGIPAGELDWIFEKVYEVGDIMRHSSAKDQFGSQGLGLGLALCKAIVNGHGGQIRVTSGLGRGSEFTITLRRVDAPVPPPTPEPELLAVHGGTPT